MEEKALSLIKDDIHNLNNWLNKITTLSGLTRYQLEAKGIDLEKLEEEKKRLVKILRDIEGYALKIGEMLNELHKVISDAEK